MVKYFYLYFQIFSIFQRLPMKSYQFFQISQRFDKEKETNTNAVINEKKQLR